MLELLLGSELLELFVYHPAKRRGRGHKRRGRGHKWSGRSCKSRGRPREKREGSQKEWEGSKEATILQELIVKQTLFSHFGLEPEYKRLTEACELYSCDEFA